MLDYIVSDFERSRISMNDNSVGAMVICDSADQAKKMYEIFEGNTRVKKILKNSFKPLNLRQGMLYNRA